MADPIAAGGKLAIFTICSNNYMPMASTFMASARRFHPEADLFVCLADRLVDMPGLYGSGWEIVPIERLAIPDFQSFTFRYDVMELNTAVKPFMFLHLFESRDYDVVLYFDPDIEVFAPLNGILDPLEDGATVALTPHALRPTEGDIDPNDLNFLRSGTYNLGFIGFRRDVEAIEVLRWWARRLLYECINDQPAGLFVDQKFVDLVPGFVTRVAILRDSAMNVAYWNLSQRALGYEVGNWTVDQRPLVFFHYSGFDPKYPQRLSKHTKLFNGNLEKPLAELLQAYAAQVNALGHGRIPRGTYAYGRFASGTPIPYVVRRMFRDSHPAWPTDPFETFELQLHRPWPGADVHSSCSVVTNFLAYLHAISPYLKSCMDIQSAQGQALLVDWFLKHAARELELDDRLVQPTALRFGDRLPVVMPLAQSPEPDLDISIIGYLRTTSGVGEVGRANLSALSDAGLRVDGYDVGLGVVADRSETSVEKLLAERPAGRVRLFNINADQLIPVMEHMRPRLTGNAYTIANPAWELADFPDSWLPAFDGVDEIWAQSRFIQLMLAKKLRKPVIHIPVPLVVPQIAQLSRSDFNIPEGRFMFFFAFDFLSFFERKNPTGAIEAFRRAFSPDMGATRPGLVIKAMNGHLAPEAMSALRDAIAEDPGIFVVESTLTRPEVASLIAMCDAVVSLHRAEGFGLLIAEAMLLGRPVIATDYSATSELVTPATGFPVDCQLVPVAQDAYPFGVGQVWADPDLDHAAWLMAGLVSRPQAAMARIAAARTHLDHHYSPNQVARRQCARLRELHLLA